MSKIEGFFSALFLGVFALAVVIVGWEDGVQGDKGVDINRAARQVSNWYTAKKVKMSVTAANITMATTYAGYDCYAFYNNRRDSSVAVKYITYPGDTISVSVPAENSTPKFPKVFKILQTGTTDSFYLLLQKQ